MSVFDPDGTRLPIKIDSTTNGEFAPVPLPEVNRIANATALTRADEISKSLGVSRRDFLVSSTGAAATLMTFNEVHASAGGDNAAAHLRAVAQRDIARRVDVADDRHVIGDG